MIRGNILAATCAAAALLAAAPASAQDRDPRLVHHEFDQDEVVRIEGKAGVQATVVFGDGEHIENVAVGDSEKWQITPNKRADTLFVKPLGPNARTNMTVITDRHTYFFDLVASASARPVYMLRFTYENQPERPDAQPDPSLAALNSAEAGAIGVEPGLEPVDPAQMNFAWRKKGDAKLVPDRIYDDGNATYLVWGVDRALPAILVVNDKGEEGPVNFAVREGTIVIDDVPDLIVLRTGKARAELRHAGPRPTAGPSRARNGGGPAVAAADIGPNPGRGN